ncbi:MAG: branched-chain amino acid transport system permease protein [Chloroflexota bacterium]|jgi:branched-chain amino acid transport system permease protein|nr:branched-chain amino acid transport system permease protein [Chloroflexota bacterium]
MHETLLVVAGINTDPAYFGEQLVLGISIGAIYALIALGYTMVYGIVELINFAHGDVFTVGAFFSFFCISLIGAGNFSGLMLIPLLLVVFLATMLFNGLLGATIERVAYRRLRNSPRLTPLITAVGMSFLLEGILYVIPGIGPNFKHYPDLLPTNSWTIAGVNVSAKGVFVVVVALVLMLMLQRFIQGTRLGKAMRATAQDRDAAQLMGVDIDRTIALTFFIGSALAGAGGIIYGLYYNSIYFTLGFRTGIVAFTAAVLGGIGNIAGAAIGGFMIGIVFSMASGYLSQQWSDVVIFSVLILVLVFKPTGLLGARVADKA